MNLVSDVFALWVLLATNQQLREEIAERKQAEEELLEHRERLEELVAERTKDLDNSRQETPSLLQDVTLQRERAEQALAKFKASQQELQVARDKSVNYVKFSSTCSTTPSSSRSKAGVLT